MTDEQDQAPKFEPGRDYNVRPDLELDQDQVLIQGRPRVPRIIRTGPVVQVRLPSARGGIFRIGE